MPALDCILTALADLGYFQDFGTRKLKPGVRLVCTGDRCDRGGRALDIITEFQRLDRENPGQTAQLFGNHELLALGGLGDVQMALEAPPGQEEVIYRSSLHARNGGLAFVREFGASPRTAFAAYAERMARGGDIGSWLRQLLPFDLACVGDRRILFVHGGIPASLADLEALSGFWVQFHAHMMASSLPQGHAVKYMLNHLVEGNHAIFWNRSIPNGTTNPDTLVTALGVDWLVIGHTPHERIERFGKRVFDIDVGMWHETRGGPPAAIIFEADGICELQAPTRTRRRLAAL